MVKNFGRRVSCLIIAIMITYFKTSSVLDDVIRYGFFEEPNGDDYVETKYLIITGAYLFVIVLIGAFTMKKVQLGEWLEKLSKSADPNAASVFIIICALYILCYWILLVQLEQGTAASILIIVFLVLNFFMLFISVFLIYKKV